MRFLIEQHIDLAQENAPMVYAQPLIGGDSNAHEWRVTVTKRGVKADIPAGSVTAYVRRDILRDDWEEEPALKVSGSASGNVISVVLPADVYAMGCPLVAVVRVAATDGSAASVAVLRATSEKLIPGAVYDPDGEVMNLDALLAQIQATKDAAAAANAAAEKANAAASHAPYVDEDGYWSVWDSGVGKYVGTGIPATGPEGPQGPPGQNGIGSGTVTGVKIGDETYEPNDQGVVELTETGSGVADSVAWGNVTGKPDTYPPASHTHPEYLGKNETAENAKQLNGKSADQYALETDLPTKASDIGALPSDGTAADSAKLGGKAPEYYIQPRNLLGNSYWEKPQEIVNQRGKTSYKSAGSSTYTIDRWLIDGTDVELSIIDGGIKIVNQMTSNRVVFIRMETGTIIAGKTYTGVICLIDGTVYCGSGTAPDSTTTLNLTTNSNDVYFQIQKTGANDQAKMVVKAGKTAEIAYCAMYEGEYTAETLPPYVPKGYAVELAECQRYDVQLDVKQNGATWFASGLAFSDTSARFVIHLPANMRDDAVPTITYSELQLLQITADNEVSKVITGIACYNITKNAAYVVVSTSGLVKGSACVLQAKQANAYINFSNDL